MKEISELTKSFPSLKGAPGVEPFDALELDAWAAGPGPSSGERVTAQFILWVWDSNDQWACGEFNLRAALSVWDAAHLAAFKAWLEKPWFA